ncbi:oligopeptidase A [Endothiovibrio diazotrophicus]
MDNPLLELDGLPPFSRIRAAQVVPAVERRLAEIRETLERLLDAGPPYTWEGLVAPLEEAEDRLNRLWSPVGHLNAVCNSDELREAYNACLPKLSAHHTEMGQNERLYRAYQSIAEGAEYGRLDAAQRKIIDNALRDFRLAGVALDEERRARFKAINQELSRLTSGFSDRVLDATHAWHRQVSDEAGLAGLPESARELARHKAELKGLEGWLFDLEYLSYFPVVTYADDRELRREFYTAYATRASDQGPDAGTWDNTPLIEQILRLRHEKAQLLGFNDFSEYSLATKMAADPEAVLHFLYDLAERGRPQALAELEAVRAFAREQGFDETLESWDIPYWSEKLRCHLFEIDQEALRPWFPVPRVLDGLFAVISRLFGMTVTALEGVDTWHPDVRFFEIRDEAGALRGQFYLDLYARAKKRGGAWMDECRVRRRHAEGVQTPVAYLTCNFTPPVGGKPALLTHDEVQTLFHEFGHGIHHMLTRVDWPSVAGINGVAWDAVELPSQFLENWCWEWEPLQLISGHVESGEPLPRELYDRLWRAKNFQAGMQMARQLEFAIFDFRLHREYDPARGGRVLEVLEEVRERVAVVRPPAFNRFAHAFTHIFAGGYAAGYYSYKWAEVLSADAFSKFEERGVFDRATGEEFLHAILERGGSAEPMELYVEFRGREPSIDALLRHNGIGV